MTSHEVRATEVTCDHCPVVVLVSGLAPPENLAIAVWVMERHEREAHGKRDG